jgi:hypothetical protein
MLWPAGIVRILAISNFRGVSMRRRLSLALLAFLVVFAVFVSTRYRSRGTRATPRVSTTGVLRDTSAALDSTAEANARQADDTMCFASRIGFPCDPR